MEMVTEKTKKTGYYLMACLLLVLFLSKTALSETNKDMKGWEEMSVYNRLYKAQELDSIRATVLKIEEASPMKGMSLGVILYVQEEKDTPVIPVHLCPSWYLSKKSIGLKKGDRIKVKGAWASIDGSDFFMASKVKKGEHFELKVRLTKDGKPFWTMTPEEIKKESLSE